MMSHLGARLCVQEMWFMNICMLSSKLREWDALAGDFNGQRYTLYRLP